MLKFLSIGLVATLTAFAASPLFEKVTIDWDNENTLEQTITLMCDDLVQDGADVTLPGKNLKDFTVSFEYGSFSPNDVCRMTSKAYDEDEDTTVFRIDANEGCEVKIKNSHSGQVALISFGSC